MTSPSYPVATSKGNESALTLGKRILLVVLVCCIHMIYFPTSNRLTGGIEPKLPIDILPIWPIWVLPYVLCYVLWLSSLVWITLKMDDRLFRSFILASILTLTIGTGTFIFFPTYVKPAALAGDDIFISLLRFIHENYGRYDAFPSSHVYITALLALFFGRWYPHQKRLWILILAIVSLSTLFTGQHYILDVMGGYVLALAGYYFSLWWTGFYSTQRQTNKPSGRRRIPSSSLN